MKTRTFALILALCFLASAFAGIPSARAASSLAYVIANTVVVRKSASDDAKSLGVASYGQSLTLVASDEGGWAKVKSGGKTGFCPLEALSTSDPNNMNVSAKVNADDAPLYKRPDENVAVWKKLKKGAVYTAVAMTRDNAWVRLKVGKKFGYMQARHLTTAVISPSVSASPEVKPTVAPAIEPGGKVYAAIAALQVFAKASTAAKSRGYLYFGQGVNCVSLDGGWAKVKNSAGKSGYCQVSGLTAANPNVLEREVQISAAKAPLYKKPVEGAAVWKRLKEGEHLVAVAVTPDGSWTRVKSGKKYAYILSSYLSPATANPTPSPSPTPAAPSSGTVYVTANAATVHAQASAKSKVLDTVPYGEHMAITAAPTGGWVAVKTESGAAGYCQTDSLSAKDPNTYSRVVYVNTANAPVYRLPLSDAPVWTKLKKNAAFTAVAITPDGEWVRLKNGKNFAYIHSAHVSASKVEAGELAYAVEASIKIYATASKKAKVLGHLYLGQSVELIGSSDGWAKVRSSSGTSCYCTSVSLSTKDPNVLNKPYYAKEKSVKLYAKPSTGAKVAATAARNDSLMVTCLSSDQTWARIALSSGYAYAQTAKLSETRIDDETLIEDIAPIPVYVVPTTISVYAKPKSGAKSLGGMSFGEKLTCTGRGSAWLRVENSVGTIGYCPVDAVTDKNPNTHAVDFYAQTKGAKVYKSPKTNAKTLAELTINERVVAVAYNEERTWFRVKNGDSYGYVQAAYFATTQIKDDSESGTIAKIVNLAKSYLGVPYVYAGQSPKGFDCSGFVYYVYKNAAKITLKRTAYTQGYDDTYKKITNKADLRVGDVLFFNTVTNDDDKCDHAGIYLGGNQFIHASSGGGKVMISSLGTDSTSYYYRTYSWARRILP